MKNKVLYLNVSSFVCMCVCVYVAFSTPQLRKFIKNLRSYIKYLLFFTYFLFLFCFILFFRYICFFFSYKIKNKNILNFPHWCPFQEKSKTEHLLIQFLFLIFHRFKSTKKKLLYSER